MKCRRGGFEKIISRWNSEKSVNINDKLKTRERTVLCDAEEFVLCAMERKGKNPNDFRASITPRDQHYGLNDETVKVTQHTNDHQKLILCQSVGLL